MSFILDALRKSDKKRPVGSVPDLQTDHLGPPPKPRRSLTPVLIVLALALLINAGLLLWWWQPWRAPAEPDLAATMQDSVPSGDVARIAEPVPAPAESVAVAAPAPSVPLPPSAPPLFALPDTPAQEAAPVQSTVIFVDAPPETAAAEPPRHAPPPAAPAAEDLALFMADIPLLDDLPAAVRAGLPDMSFSLHYYTVNPAERLVRINGRLLREGQMLAEGLVLEEITTGGAVFEHRGLLFEVLRY